MSIFSIEFMLKTTLKVDQVSSYQMYNLIIKSHISLLNYYQNSIKMIQFVCQNMLISFKLVNTFPFYKIKE